MKRTILTAFALALCAVAGPNAVPHRIVSLSPNVTEMLYGVGALDQVVGISDYCTYPPDVNRLPSVGGWHNPNLEKIAALRPDLVIVDDGQAPFVEENFRKLGLRMMVVADHTVQDVYAAITSLGQVTGHEEAALKLTASTRSELLRISQKTAALPKPKVVLIVERTPGTLRDLYTATEGGFLAELVALAGGRIAVPPARRGYGKLSKEDLLAIDPDVILDFIHGVKSRFAGDPMEAWRDMAELKAVRTRRVHGVNEEFVPHASQRMVQTAALFARLIHAEVSSNKVP
jgi:iron complex transport system substrate-binding protein